jgi:hypothetical protein
MAGTEITTRLKEQLEILVGYRPRNQQDAAVRVKDMEKALTELETKILETIRREMSP